MKRIIYLLPLFGLLLHTSIAISQSAVDHENIFSLHHNRVGIPKDNSLFVYSLKSKSWEVSDTIALPENYLALDGNIRRVYIFMDEKVVFHGFHGEYNDTLLFSDTIGRPRISHWIRTPYSTEKDFSAYENERHITYVKDGGQWYKIDVVDRMSFLFKDNDVIPLLTEKESAPFKKLYSFKHGSSDYLAAVFEDQVTFHRYELRDEYMEAIKLEFESKGQPYPTLAELVFKLPAESKTAFIYNYNTIAVIFPDAIRFYEYDYADKLWHANFQIPDLEYGN